MKSDYAAHLLKQLIKEHGQVRHNEALKSLKATADLFSQLEDCHFLMSSPFLAKRFEGREKFNKVMDQYRHIQLTQILPE